jgi:hypothetical protein
MIACGCTSSISSYSSLGTRGVRRPSAWTLSPVTIRNTAASLNSWLKTRAGFLGIRPPCRRISVQPRGADPLLPRLDPRPSRRIEPRGRRAARPGAGSTSDACPLPAPAGGQCPTRSAGQPAGGCCSPSPTRAGRGGPLGGHQAREAHPPTCRASMAVRRGRPRRQRPGPPPGPLRRGGCPGYGCRCLRNPPRRRWQGGDQRSTALSLQRRRGQVVGGVSLLTAGSLR